MMYQFDFIERVRSEDGLDRTGLDWTGPRYNIYRGWIANCDDEMEENCCKDRVPSCIYEWMYVCSILMEV